MREHEDSIIHKSRRLFQQFVVDSFSMIESQRLYEIRKKQSTIRGEVLQGITMTDEELQTFCLIEIEKLLQANEKSLRDFAVDRMVAGPREDGFLMFLVSAFGLVVNIIMAVHGHGQAFAWKLIVPQNL
ncbi:hypothetical protein Ahy_A06g030112 [Arachis hypogaea]|uniref:Helitron helicase-like domain-containing protein n=1 Tax=Arachis hypogaea TaxID=3818 RepID=A0A445CVD2_ARAHY|nr:hypothetical protein Ahy_A06g030112 [Arachis hypogaea]